MFLNRDFDTWDSFKEFFRDYFGLPQQRRDQFLFRGLPDSNWTLKSTLDLCRTFPSDQERSAAVTQLLREFRRESIRTGIAFSQLPDDIGLELLARHHGLPSPLIDWTDSPFIAAFFAFEASIQTHAERVVVYLLDRARWPETEVPITIVDDINTVRFNRRALQQRGAFLRVGTSATPLEQLLDSALGRATIPTSDRARAMDELEKMNIDATHLFMDLDAAARTATRRVLG